MLSHRTRRNTLFVIIRRGGVRRRRPATFSPMEQAVADLVGPDLRVLFCGINPGARSGELGLHFARPGNRFWKLLHAGGFTESVLAPEEQHILPALGVGITNLVARVTAAASELSAAELREGAAELESRVEVLRPRCVAVLGLQAYRTAFRRPDAMIGPQPERIGPSLLWLLPNPSGLQARYQMPEMGDMFTALFVATGAA
jgi:double-stranded uracil-DNA glycosylase